MSWKQFSRRLTLWIVPAVVALLMRLFYKTYRLSYQQEGDWPQGNCVVVGWHGELFVNPLVYRHFRPKQPVVAVASRHFHGDLIAGVIQKAGRIGAIRGSSKRGGREVLLQAIKCLQQGMDVILTPDGPRGPRQVLQPGALSMARRVDGQLVIVTVRPENYWQFNSWDGFFIPKPFSRVQVFVQCLKLTEFDDEALAQVQEKMRRHALN